MAAAGPLHFLLSTSKVAGTGTEALNPAKVGSHSAWTASPWSLGDGLSRLLFHSEN